MRETAPMSPRTIKDTLKSTLSMNSWRSGQVDFADGRRERHNIGLMRHNLLGSCIGSSGGLVRYRA
jgi:hypothetical protein